jgi:S1-C subfamily serine protease
LPLFALLCIAVGMASPAFGQGTNAPSQPTAKSSRFTPPPLNSRVLDTPSRSTTNVAPSAAEIAFQEAKARADADGTLMQPREIAERILPSTVLLVMRDAKSKPLALGSGFVVGEGKVVSNFHVIEGASAGMAKLVGKEGNVEVLGILAKNEEMDLVLLSVPGIIGKAVNLSSSKAVAIGDPVYACGNLGDSLARRRGH